MKPGARIHPFRFALRLAILVVVLGAGAFYVPTPYILNAPGHAERLEEIVRVPGGHPQEPGHFYMTTVIYEKANILFCLYALMDRDAQLLREEEYSPFHAPSQRTHPPELPDAYNPELMMEQSKYIASVEALRYLGYHVPIESHGVRVLGFLEGSPARGRLRREDVIVKVGKTAVRSVQALHAVLDAAHGGQEVSATVQRAGRETPVPLQLIEVHGRALIGIMTQDAVDPVKLPVDVQITTHNINGASAGLMFTLEILHQMLPHGLANGRRVAGTGTMNLHGEVGPVEGARLKAIAARRVGAEVFLAPLENVAEARAGAGSMKVIAVGSLADAVAALGGPPPLERRK